MIYCRPDLVNVPVSSRNQLSLGHPLIVVMDSLNIHRGLEVEQLRRYLEQEWLMKESRKYRGARPDFSAQSILSLHPPNLPVQPNSSDCGVYTLEFAERTLDR